MKKLLLAMCLVFTTGIADAKSKRNDYHSKHYAPTVHTIVYSNMGAVRISPRNDLVKIIVIERSKPKTRYIKSHKAVRKKIHNRHHYSHAYQKHFHKKHSYKKHYP